MRRLGLVLVLAGALLLPAGASALQFEIVNQSGRSADRVYVTVAGSPSGFEVPGMG